MERVLIFCVAFSAFFLIIGFVADKILNITTQMSNVERKKWEANVLGILFSLTAGPLGVYYSIYPQNPDVFTEIILASRTQSKCDEIAKDVKNKHGIDIQTEQVDADHVDQLKTMMTSAWKKGPGSYPELLPSRLGPR